MKKSAWHYMKQYRLKSLMLKNLVFVMLGVALPILVVVHINYGKYNEQMNRRITDMNEEILQKYAAVTDNLMQGIMELLRDMSQQEDVLNVMQAVKADAGYYDTVERIYELIKEYTQMNQYITQTYIYSNINRRIIDGQTGVSREAEKCPDKGKWYYIHRQIPMEEKYILVDSANSIFICQPVYTEYEKSIGLIVFAVDLGKTKELFVRENISQKGLFFVVDISGQIMNCSQPEFGLLGEERQIEYKDEIGSVRMGETGIVTNDVQKFISVMASSFKSWKYALITEQPQYAEEVGSASDFLFSSAIAGILTSLVAVYIITNISYQPVRKIMDVIEEPQLYPLNEESFGESNEVLYITSNILNTLNSKERTDEELKKRMASLHQAQALALQFQIEPHFLYNTLETIRWTAVEEAGRGNRTSRLITKVAKLYRIGLESGNAILPLKEELDFLRIYIDILNVRFSNKIQFIWQVEDEVLECRVIKMCVQPLVENAIKHGLKTRGNCGCILIGAHREMDRLLIMVENDGEEISEDRIREVNLNLRQRIRPKEAGIGLYNVNERIKLIYGNEYGIRLEKRTEGESGGSRTVMIFPFQ